MPYKSRLERQQKELTCPNCSEIVEIDIDCWSSENETSIDRCVICDCRHLYRQRDFNRALGCSLVAIGAILVPWTYGLSLVLLSLVDLILYYRLPESVVCYQCDTVYRDARPMPRQNDFDLLKHDVLKYGKSWQELEDQ